MCACAASANLNNLMYGLIRLALAFSLLRSRTSLVSFFALEIHYFSCWHSVFTAMAERADHTKTVLVCLGERKREVTFCSRNDENDRKTLLEETLKVYGDVLDSTSSGQNHLNLQLKREEWEGQFVDIIGMKSIPDKSVLRAQQVTPLRQKVSAEKMNIINMLL